MRIVTIGGYGFTEQSFVGALKRAEVDVFIDVRQRRGMRGAKYAFLNSKRLQTLLADAGIRYIHALDLAPTASVRAVQKDVDRSTGILKQDRQRLSPAFVQKYRSEILAEFESQNLESSLGGANKIALFCVESHPSACHRLLAAEYLSQIFHSETPVEHLMR